MGKYSAVLVVVGKKGLGGEWNVGGESYRRGCRRGSGIGMGEFGGRVGGGFSVVSGWYVCVWL